MANYIGKIAAVGTINMSQIASGLNASARDVEKYARTVRSTIVSANSAAGRSFQEIFTPLQRLERALQAANTRTLDIKVGGSAERIRAIVGAANDIARPLGASQKQFAALSATIQNEFIGSLTRAQNAAQLAESAINRGQIKNAAGYERLKRVIDEARSSISRLGEAGSAVSGLATGRELRFQQAGFAAELQRTSALQSQASTLPADARASGAVAQLVELQRREAEEAARLLAVLENVRNTRRGDAAAAQANLDAQTQRLSQVNAQLERQVALSNEAVRLAGERATREREIEQNIGAATQLRSTTDATGRSIQQRVRDIATLREEEARRATAARDAAEADEIAASSARLRAQAASQLLGVLQQESQLISNQGAASTTDATGRSIQQRVQDIAALREEEARRATAARDAAEADEIAASSARLRAQAASQLLGVLQQESQLISNQGAASTTDATGRSIQQRAQDIAALREEEARRAELSADQQRRREVATALLPPVIDLPPDPRQVSLERTQALAGRLGPDVSSSATALATLESSTVSLKNQIAQLPEPFRAQLIPAIRQAEAELIRLTAADDALPEDIERASQALRGLTTGVTRAQRAAASFGGTFREFADNADIQGAAGRLQFLRQQLLRATGDTTRAEQAADDLAAAFQRAANTPGGFRQAAAQLNQVEREAVEAAAAVLRVRPNRLAEQLQRAGDVSRGAFGNTGLAVQQAIFAFDDFFSVTGDLSQRIRAAGNNISQLGFIIGGTAGLITGVALSAFSQVAVALINWANSGRTAEDQTKAFNDALSRQKSLAEELAQAFSSLGDSIARRAFSGPAQEARAFREELDDIVGKLRELRDQRALGLDERVQTARADASVAERELGGATTRDQAVAAQRRLDEARRRLAAEESRVRNRPDVTLDQATARAQEVFDQATARAALSAQGNAAIGGPSASAIARDAAVNAGNAIRDGVLAGLGGVNDPAQARQVLSDAQARASERGDARLAGQLEELINSLDAPIRRAADEFAARLFSSASTAAQQIELAQDNIAKAIQSGVPGALSIRRSLDRAAEEIDAARVAISEAQRDFAESGQTRADADVRDERLRDADRRLQRGREAREAAVAQARDADKQRIVGPQFTLEARRSRIEQNIQQSGISEGLFARRLRELEAQRSQLIADAEADPGNVFAQERAEQGIAEIDEQARALEAATLALRTFADGLNKASQSAQANVQSAQQDADEARRRNIRLDTPQTRADRESASAALDRQRDAQRIAERDIQLARGRLEDRVLQRGAALGVNDPFARIGDINNQLASGGLGTPQREELLKQRDLIQNSIQDLVDQFDAAAGEISDRQERIRQVSVSVKEGRELIQTPAQRAGEQLSQQLDSVRLAASDRVIQREAQQRVLADNIRQVAPLRVQFGEEVANAILQGPSRAALQVSDATTVEGSRELSRLLRGDDPARDVNLIELQRQTQALEELLRIAREQGVLIAE